MKKYIIGMLFGFALSFAFGARAEVQSLINKAVEGTYPVTIEGKKLTSEALVIEGSTYLPVRSFGEATGYKVSFDPGLGVSLDKKTVEPVAQTIKPTEVFPKMSIEELENDIYTATSQIKINGVFIANYERRAKEEASGASGYQKSIDELKRQNEDLKTKLSELEKQKSALQP